VLGGAALSLLFIGAGAAWIPARRAARVDPVAALRTE
jgi:ABC-type antimicrobial peptide transport system permease subunit